GLRQPQLAALLAYRRLLHLEIHQVAVAIADVAASGPDAIAPPVEVELTVQLHVGATETNALAIDAREVRLAADASAIAAIEGVVPHVQFPHIRRIDGGHVIDCRHEPAIGPGHL